MIDLSIPEYVWYLSERDEVIVSPKNGFLFKDEHGEFMMLYAYEGKLLEEMLRLDYIGEF